MNSVDELLNLVDDDELHMNLLKSRVKHLFILSENGKPVFTRFTFNINHCFHLIIYDLDMKLCGNHVIN